MNPLAFPRATYLFSITDFTRLHIPVPRIVWAILWALRGSYIS